MCGHAAIPRSIPRHRYVNEITAQTIFKTIESQVGPRYSNSRTLSRLAGADEEKPDVDNGEQVYGLSRLLALSDGVFAFAMTLLVVQLLVPQLGPGQVGQLGTKLLDQLASYVSYLISFTVISIYWYSHHRLFRYVRRWDFWLIALNLGALLFIAVMPFPTAIMGRYGDQTVAVVIYAAILGSAGLFIWLMWWFGIRATSSRQASSSTPLGCFGGERF
jgi:uncharacterized membrane protein